MNCDADATGNMSAAAEGISELGSGDISVATLFGVCLEGLDIVVTAREFTEEYELLCAQV